MNNTVLHLIRKNAQLKASFVKNQIENHIDFYPFVAYKFSKYKRTNGGFSNFKNDEIEELNLSDTETIWDRIIFKLFKRISRKQGVLIHEFIKKNEI